MKKVLRKEAEKIKLDEQGLKNLEDKAENLVKILEKEIKKRKIEADVFVGGSLAKKTILRRKIYDIDIFVRFGKRYKEKEISKILEKIIKKLKSKKIHGSRDYFQLRQGRIIFEIIPVIKILKPKDAKNVTDLSFFHVNYVKNQIKKKPKLVDDIILAKHFCYIQKCYGAESYIRGFSGYGLELLIIHYGSFVKFLRDIIKAKMPIIIDPKKYYKKNNIMIELNESKLQSPIIFVDPTYKERNVLAALSYKTFEKFRKQARKFLSKPSSRFFIEKEINSKDYNLILIAKTSKQAGDIAGSKLVKFYNFLSGEIEKYFEINKREFEYGNRKEAKLYFKIKVKKEIIKKGPPITAVEHLSRFRKKHKNVFIKKGRVYAREKIKFNVRSFVNKFKKKNKKVMRAMGITSLKAE